MTPVQTRANGLVIPPLPQLLLTAALRAFVELVLYVVSTLRMCFRRLAVNATRPMPATLPRGTNDIQLKEASVATGDILSQALILRDREAIVSKDEGMLTAGATPTASFSGLSRESRLARQRACQFVVPVIPAKAGTQSYRNNADDQRTPPWIPAFAGRAEIEPRSPSA